MREFKLIIRYEGLKATQHFQKFTQESKNVVRADLIEFGLPHPKGINIQLLSHGVVECLWEVQGNNPILEKHLYNKTDPSHNPDVPAIKAKLSISHLTLKTDSKKAGVPHSKNLKRPYPPDQHFQTSHLENPFHKQHKSLPEDAFRSAVNPYSLILDESSSGSGVGGSSLPRKPYSKEEAAWYGHSTPPPQNFPSSNAECPSRPVKAAKTHTGTFDMSAKQAPVFDETRPRITSVTQTATVILERKKSKSSTIAHSGPRPLISEKLPTDGPESVRVKAEDQVVEDFLNTLDLNSESSSATRTGAKSTGPKGRPSTGPLSAVAKDATRRKEPQEIADMDASFHASAKQSGPQNATAVLPTPPPSAPFSTNGATFSMATSSSAFSASEQQVLSRPRPKEENLSSIRHLTKEAVEVMKRVHALVKREDEIVDELTKLGSAWIPKRFTFSVDLDLKGKGKAKDTQTNAETNSADARHRQEEDYQILKQRLEKCEKLLEAERLARQDERRLIDSERRLRMDERRLLEEERRRREEAENAILDVRRECKEPFVVPSLLDAFVGISKLTTRGVRRPIADSEKATAVVHPETEGPSAAKPPGTNANGGTGVVSLSVIDVDGYKGKGKEPQSSRLNPKEPLARQPTVRVKPEPVDDIDMFGLGLGP